MRVLLGLLRAVVGGAPVLVRPAVNVASRIVRWRDTVRDEQTSRRSHGTV